MGAPRQRPPMIELPPDEPHKRPLAERFWEKCDKSGGPDACWPWMGSFRALNYGEIWVGDGKEMSHRVAWMLTNGTIPPDLVVDHICKVHSCQNPAHMRLVKQSDNCGVLANPTPHWNNKLKTHCPRGHEYTPENTALFKTLRKGGKRYAGRQCLTCYPWYWKHAIVPRERPPRGYTKDCEARLGKNTGAQGA